ncbi:MAG: hypothetical protein SCALA702_08610 [Melioribacteraceae bacterium]|nr:MAG: hypothetical protein SCALA702_08610 [Melioribacteraceae bacterium]
MDKIKIFSGALLLILITACSLTDETTKTEIDNPVPEKSEAPEPEKFSFNELESWINLMPGGSDSFHLSGDLVITENSGLNLKNAQILEVVVFQDGKQLYEFKPETKKGYVSEEESAYFQFSTKRGLKISGLLKTEFPIVVEVHLTDGDENMVVTVDKVLVQKIY